MVDRDAKTDFARGVTAHPAFGPFTAAVGLAAAVLITMFAWQEKVLWPVSIAPLFLLIASGQWGDGDARGAPRRLAGFGTIFALVLPAAFAPVLVADLVGLGLEGPARIGADIVKVALAVVALVGATVSAVLWSRSDTSS